MRLQQSTSQAATGAWTSTGDIRRSAWPDAVAYREAIQTPHLALADPTLQEAGIALDRRGLPIAYAGRFAIVFKLVAASGETWALRCFTSPGDDAGTTRNTRYKLIQKHVDSHRGIFAPFRYIERGIKVGANWYPALVMRWASGEPLGRWVEKNRDNPAALTTLCGALTDLLVELEKHGIAHGDWQHDNLLVADGGRRVTLVDYDGMYVPELEGQPNTELGHPNYQHPSRTADHFGPGLDRFSCLVIQTALLGLARDPHLWERFSDGESLLFKRDDLLDPDNSPVFHELRALAELDSDETLSDAIARLEDACIAGAMSTLLPAVAGGVADTDKPAYEPVSLSPAARWHTAEVVTGEGAKETTGASWLKDQLGAGGGGGAGARNGAVAAAAAGGAVGQWWTLPETVTKVSAAPPRQAAGGQVLQRARRVSVAGPPREVFDFIERERSAETRQAEQKHLWAWRFGAAGLAGFFLLLLYAAFRTQNAFLPIYFAWILNYANLGYSKWPRKVIHDELTAEIAKMEELIAQRNRKIAEKGGLITGNGPQGQALTTVADYVAEKLRQTSINRVLTVPGIHVSTLRQLRQDGVHTALDLQRRTQIPQVPPHQITALQNWCRELEGEAAAEYRKTVGTTRSLPAEVERLRVEVAEFERHVAMRKRERDQFPDRDFWTYWYRLIGQDDTAAPSPSTPSAPPPGPVAGKP